MVKSEGATLPCYEFSAKISKSCKEQGQGATRAERKHKNNTLDFTEHEKGLV